MENKSIHIAHFTGTPTHYQLSLGEALADSLKGDFVQVYVEKLHEERKNLGWDDSYNQEWLIRTWDSERERERALNIFRSADIAIWGLVPVSEINDRVKKGKITFLYSERIFKRGKWRLLSPRVIRDLVMQFGQNNYINHHLLCVGPYCAEDYKLLRLFNKRMWRWGYFPEIPNLVDSKRLDHQPIILWAGRMLTWKRVDLLLRSAAWARAKGGRFQLLLIGNGPEEERLRSLMTSLDLSDICKFMGPLSPKEVGKAMESASIYVFPSDQQEGWGVVVNEAMSRECCVIGSKSTGSIPWLIRDGENGRIFEVASVENLGNLILSSVSNPEWTMTMGKAARKTVEKLWSPRVAANRFLQLCEALESGQLPPFHDEGPCSPV